MRATTYLTMLLIALVAVAAGWLAQRYPATADWTAGNRNSLTAASRRVIAALGDGPIEFTAYIYPGAQRADVRQRLSRYTRASSRVHLHFVDPARHPATVRKLGIDRDGAVVVTYQGRRQTLTDYTESSVTNALQRLSPGGTKWIVFVTGHGERDPSANNSAGYSTLARALGNQGLKVRQVNLVQAGAVPDNAAVLVIASPQHELLPGEVDMIRAWVERGGNVLWVDDPGARYGLTPLAQDLGIHWLNGTLVYPDFRKLGTGSPAIALAAGYPSTPITAHLNQITVFAFAGALSPLADSPWRAQAILRSPTRSWLETGPLNRGSISFQPDHGDRAGPLVFGMALSRPRPGARHVTSNKNKQQQRAVVVADSDFMDNGHIGQLGNRTLALAMFQWLAGRDAQIAVDVPRAPDAHLQMAPARLRTFWWAFVIALPGALFLFGLGRWWRRRRR
ncbi:GldG family protein [Salinisphaera sp.]|uniref:GldG family protein n=1 Tax=Salinisphaera sp. TaxID=1914330 RepID=UPI002D7A1BEC|nr:GldG family protein [Salinisphaera sp.]HET7315609.1 GldG family protein [Salinisphaera sp.]